MKIVSIIGYSGSGKTALAEAIIRELGRRGCSVGAIKHTHHPIDRENRGDTLRFLNAGAAAVVLINETTACQWTIEEGGREIEHGNPLEVAQRLSKDWVVVEGYKEAPLGVAIALATDGQSLLSLPGNVARVVGDGLAHDADGVAELVTFLDRIITYS